MFLRPQRFIGSSAFERRLAEVKVQEDVVIDRLPGGFHQRDVHRPQGAVPSNVLLRTLLSFGVRFNIFPNLRLKCRHSLVGISFYLLKDKVFV